MIDNFATFESAGGCMDLFTYYEHATVMDNYIPCITCYAGGELSYALYPGLSLWLCPFSYACGVSRVLV